MAENVRALPVAEGSWTKERIELIKRTVCPKGITDDELALFVEQCKRSGLDPLLKQAFCVPRRQNIGTRDAPQWVEKREFQPAEAGMLARAEKFSDFRGVTASAVHKADKCIIDAGEGTVSHAYSPGSGRGPVIGAWAKLLRKDMVPIVVWLDMEGYSQSTPLWSRIPGNMIEKCARVAALRKAYPEAFGGLYIEEEASFDELTSGQSEQPKPLAASKTAEVKGQLTAKLQAENQLAAKVSRMQIKDESTLPDRPPPAEQTIDAPKAEAAKPRTPYEEIAEFAEMRGVKPGALMKEVGVSRRKQADVTAEDLAKVRAYVQALEATKTEAGDIEE